MYIDDFIWLPGIIEKLSIKHHVTQDEVEEIVQTLPIEIIDADWNLTREAAKLKAFKKMSYADCFAAALAIMYSGELITGDPEFKAVEDQIRILWIKSG
jgi:predicted nucleic acid-binding protein